MSTKIHPQCVYLPGPDHPRLGDVAHALFLRNCGDYADPALVELAWTDQEVRGYWLEQVEAVRADLETLARHGRVPVRR